MGNPDLYFIFVGRNFRWVIDVKGNDYCSQLEGIRIALDQFKKKRDEYLDTCEFPHECDFTILEIIIAER